MMHYQIKRSPSLIALLSIVGMIGCENDAGKETVIAKKPRPVEVATLIQSTPPDSSLVSASVVSWKTEEIAMEVGGRVEWVIEPNEDVLGRVTAKDGTVIEEGTPIARIDSERYFLQRETAQAEKERAQQNIEGAETELESSIPAQILAARADETLAKTEYERSKRLFDQDAGAEADVDRDKAKFEGAKSQIQQLLSLEKSKQAELKSLKLQLLQSEKSLRDAEANLEDCVLHSSFNGQISDVSVVQGSIVSAGQAITV